VLGSVTDAVPRVVQVVPLAEDSAVKWLPARVSRSQRGVEWLLLALGSTLAAPETAVR
jgi:hypothetical protein